MANNVDIAWLQAALTEKPTWQAKAQEILDGLQAEEFTTLADITRLTKASILVDGKQLPDAIIQLLKDKAAANSDPSLEQRMKALETDVAFLRLSRFESLSHVAVFNMIEERYGLIDDSRELWRSIPEPDVALVTDLWANFDTTELDGTEPQCQIVMERLFARLLGVSSPLRSWAKVTIPNPEKVPDISISTKKDAALSWKTLLVPIELEKQGNSKEGIGQVISYMISCLTESRRPTVLGVYSDGDKIDIIRVRPARDQLSAFFHSGLLDLFPTPKPQNYTSGFSALIRVLSTSLNDLGAITHPASIDVGSSTFQVAQYIADGCKSRVYKCIAGNQQEVVVKLSLGGGSEHFLNEAHILRLLERHDPAGIYFPQLLGAESDKLVLFPYAPFSLRTYATQITQEKQVFSIVAQIVTILKVAHLDAQVLHNDIRPSNVIVDSTGKLRLIDWGLGNEIRAQMPNVYGTIAYASSKFLTRAATIASPATDLESAVYILLFLKNGHLPWHKAQTTTAVETSRKQIVDPDVLALLAIIQQERNAAHDSMITFLQHAQDR